MKRSLIMVIFWAGLMVQTLGATHSTSHVFPQFADGRFADGTYYRTTLMITNVLGTAATCSWRLYGMTTTLDSGATGSSFTATFPTGLSANSLHIARTTGTQAFQSGYATVTCDVAVAALVLYSFYAPGGLKLSEATVFPSVPNTAFLMTLDNRESARLGLAVANNTDSQRTYLIQLMPAGGGSPTQVSIVVQARSTLTKFVDEIMSIPLNNSGLMIMASTDSSNFSLIGLRFTGSAFTTLPAFP